MNILKLMLILSAFGCFMGIKCSAPAGYGAGASAASDSQNDLKYQETMEDMYTEIQQGQQKYNTILAEEPQLDFESLDENDQAMCDTLNSMLKGDNKDDAQSIDIYLTKEKKVQEANQALKALRKKIKTIEKKALQDKAVLAELKTLRSQEKELETMSYNAHSALALHVRQLYVVTPTEIFKIIKKRQKIEDLKEADADLELLKKHYDYMRNKGLEYARSTAKKYRKQHAASINQDEIDLDDFQPGAQSSDEEQLEGAGQPNGPVRRKKSGK